MTTLIDSSDREIVEIALRDPIKEIDANSDDAHYVDNNTVETKVLLAVKPECAATALIPSGDRYQYFLISHAEGVMGSCQYSGLSPATMAWYMMPSCWGSNCWESNFLAMV